MMKKLLKRLSSIGVTAMMLLSLCAPAFAAGDEAAKTSSPVTPGATASVTVGVSNPEDKAANGSDELLAYKVVGITYDDQSNELTYTFTDLFKAFQQDKAGETWKNLKPKAYGEMNDKDLKTLLGAFTAYIKGQTPAPDSDYKATANASGVAAFGQMAMGQYIIVGNGTSKGARIYQTVTVNVEPEKTGSVYTLDNSFTVAMKTSKPTIGKEITAGTVEDDKITTGDQGENDKHDKHQQTSEIGKVVTYKLTIAVPTYPEGATNKTFYVGDVLSKGLTLDAKSVTVKGDDKEVTADPSTYQVKSTVDPETGATSLFVDFDFDKISMYKTVTVTYQATINKDAALGTTEGNKNNAELVYSNSPFDGNSFKPGDTDRPTDKPGYGKDEDMEIVYTYALVIDKFEEKHEDEKLSGATFELYRSYSNGTYSEPVMADGKPVTLVTDANGAAAYAGLQKGTYYLKETVAPTGYNLLTEPVVIDIDASNIPFMTETNKTVTHYTYTTDASQAMTDHEDQAKINGVPVWMNAAGEVATGAAAPAEGGYTAAYVASEKTTVDMVIEITTDGKAGAGFYKAGVANSTGAQLPSTGGIGTTMFYLVGGFLVLGAGILLITKRRMQGREE